MPNKRKQRTPPLIIDGNRYKYVESHDGLCQECVGFPNVSLCLKLPSCVDGGYFVEVAKKP